VIGIGMRSHAGVAATAFKALADRKINIRAITTSEIKFSLPIDAEYAELAVRTLHSLHNLDKRLSGRCVDRNINGLVCLASRNRLAISPPSARRV
jgi:ACT domain